MRILVDILHPAHVHFFAPFHAEMTTRGHELRVASRHKDLTCELLDAKEIPHEPISARRPTGRGGHGGLWREAWARFGALDRIAREFRPDVITGCMGPVAVLVGRRRRVPVVVFYNNETAHLANRVAQRFATAYVTGRSFRGGGGPNHVVHDSFHELAYLHPARFTPDPGIRAELGVRDDEKLIVVRFVSLTSSHDRGVHGIPNRAAFVAALAGLGRVFVSTEDPWDAAWRAEAVPAPERFHHVLAAADLVVGESATVAAEAGLLGTPSIYAADSPRGYLDELEQRGLVIQARGEDAAARAAAALAADGPPRPTRPPTDLPDLVAWAAAFFEDRSWHRPASATRHRSHLA